MSPIDTEKLARVFVELADSMVDDFDVVDLLNLLVARCTDLLDVDAAGVLFAGAQEQLQVTASSSESARLLDLYQLQNEGGPCLECYRTGQPVFATLEEAHARWPGFAADATREGFVSVLALPMRLRDRVIGALNLFDSKTGTLADPSTPTVAQAMADVATISILQERAGRERAVLNEQLQNALSSRVVIEQAKGVLATRLDTDMPDAFELMRKRARDERRGLVEVAEEVLQARGADTQRAYPDQT